MQEDFIALSLIALALYRLSPITLSNDPMNE